MSLFKDQYSLVLSGGGAKGSYEIGAWEAFRELGIQFNAITGVSIGALNAALMVQDDFDKALELWNSISIEKVIKLPEELLKNGKFEIASLQPSHIKAFNKGLFKNFGLDSTPLLNMIRENADEPKIRRSKIDMGIVTVEVPKLRPLEIFTDQMPQGLLPDYLLASASFPMFRNAVIDGRRFTDGGIYDNIPHRMLKERGYKRIIIIDVSGIGSNKRPDIAGTQTTYIKNSIKMGGVLDFDPGFITNYRRLGYLDTMKVFEKNSGQAYFFHNDRRFEKKLESGLTDPEIIHRFTTTFVDAKESETRFIPLLRKYLPREMRLSRNLIHALAECAAHALQLKRIHLYTFKELADTIQKKRDEIPEGKPMAANEYIRSYIKGLNDRILMFNRNRDADPYIPYEYALRAGFFREKKKGALDRKTFFNVYPELPGAFLFLDILEQMGRHR